RIISPVYWEGPVFEVRRSTWFMQGDGSKWIPCEENLAEQIELGYYKHRPYNEKELELADTTKDVPSAAENKDRLQASEEKKLEMSLQNEPVEKQWHLQDAYSGQYIIYTGRNSAWLLYNTASSKIAKTIITRLTNKQNLGGTRLIRGYPEVEKETKPKPTPASSPSDKTDIEMEHIGENSEQTKEEVMASQEEEDYQNENSEEEVRKIDHLVFVIHGIGQKMSERLGQNFVHDVNILRKTLKSAYPTVIGTTSAPLRKNSIQVLPILWRHEIKFGMASGDEGRVEADLGAPDGEDGCPTLDELTLEGVPNIRMVVSDVLLDVPLYMTQKYREQMTIVISQEITRVYKLFVERHPDFAEAEGKVSLLGHSLGSLLAFDILTMQPMSQDSHLLTKLADRIFSKDDKKQAILPFAVQNFFALGSPLGIILLLRGFKIASRKCLAASNRPNPNSLLGELSINGSPVSYCYPAVEHMYNIFHKCDPVAYRLEPLIARHYTTKLKPVPIPYIKGGLKSVIDAGFTVGSDIASRAGAMYESFKSGLTSNLLMRGFGLSRQEAEDHTESHGRSQSEPALFERHAIEPRRSKTVSALDSQAKDEHGAKRLLMLNSTGRVDFCLQEGILENPYLSAFSVHMNYWQDLDVAAFLVRQLYK
ncbi:hypothetical protein DFQ28_008238, partial [Apophysomyces sp. BC1034]